MSLEVGNKYKAVVTGAYATEKEDGTFGIALSFHADEGDIEHTLWIEPGEFLQYRRRDLKTLGATDDDLVSWEWLQAPASLVGAKCGIVIGEYLNKKTSKMCLTVKYINSLRRESTSARAQAAARLLGGTPQAGYPIGGPMPGRESQPTEPLWGKDIIDEQPPPY